MKVYNFNQTGGLKLTTETLSGLQDAYMIYNGVAKMAGDKAILSGCETLGNTVTDGTVLINGELLDFRGAVKQDTVIIKEESTNLQFEDGSIKPFTKNRYATFGFSADAIQWNQFKRVPILTSIPQTINDLSTTLNNKIDAFVNALGYLRKGAIYLGDLNGHPSGWTYSGSDYTVQLMNNVNNPGQDLYQVTFNSPLEVNSYRIFICLNYSGNWSSNNNVLFNVTSKTSTGFQISMREINSELQDLTIDYIIFKN